jgi:hypothetical protein
VTTEAAKPRPAKPTRFADPELDRVLRELREEVDRLAALPAAGAVVVADVELADGKETPVPHGLGRPARWARESCVRGASSTGRVEEVRSDAYDRAQFVVLKATGWGATITCDLAVL